MSSMSNAGQQTRGLSAGDWVRLQRLRGARTSGYSYGSYAGDLTNNKDIAPTQPATRPRGMALLIPNDSAGTSKTLRPSSKWTDFVASRTADFVTQSQSTTNPNADILTVTKLCDCSSTTLTTRIGLCRSCVVPAYYPTYKSRTVYAGPNPAIHRLTVFRI